jgi:hypothetical protein
MGEGQQFPLQMAALDPMGNGWRRATLQVDTKEEAEVIRSLCQEHSVAVGPPLAT